MGAKFGPVEEVEVFTEQAVSGAGYPGVSSMDIVDNVIPYISGEEDKLENEAQKILGSLNADATAFEEQSSLRIGATCTRVGVTDGHMAFVSLRFKNRQVPSAEEVKQALRNTSLRPRSWAAHLLLSRPSESSMSPTVRNPDSTVISPGDTPLVSDVSVMDCRVATLI